MDDINQFIIAACEAHGECMKMTDQEYQEAKAWIRREAALGPEKAAGLLNVFFGIVDAKRETA